MKIEFYVPLNAEKSKMVGEVLRKYLPKHYESLSAPKTPEEAAEAIAEKLGDDFRRLLGDFSKVVRGK